MMETLAPAAMLLTAVVLIALVRSQSALVRLAVEGGALVAIVILLNERSASPLLISQPLPVQPSTPWLRALTIAWWLIGARLAVTISSLAMRRDARLRQARLFSDILAVAIYVSAALEIASSVLNLQLRGLVATSGIIAVVLGFALQNTLSDLFSGLAVGVEHPFTIGDVISVGTEVTGTVVQTNWRSVWVRTDKGDIAAVPNGSIARALLTNHNRPTAQRTASVDVRIRSTWSTGRLSDLLSQALLLCPTILTVPAPSILVKDVGRRSIEFMITFHVADGAALLDARSNLLRQVRRFVRHSGADAGQRGEDRPLSDVGLFRGLPLERVVALRQACRSRRLAAGSTLIACGETVDKLVIVTSGVLDVSLDAGRERSIGRVGPGEYLGEVSMMSGEPSPVTVVALTGVELLELSKDDLVGLVDGDVSVVYALQEAVRQGITVVERDRAAREAQPIGDKHGFLRKIAELLSAPVYER